MNEANYSKACCDCVVMPDKESAQSHGFGGIWYSYRDERKRWPQDVSAVHIFMPVTVEEASKQSYGDMGGTPVLINWDVPRWTLTGSYELPTLNPSLHWIGVWHGWLRNGRLESC